LKLAAIDIGSNAVRLLITDVFLNAGRKPEFIKSNLIRVPLRLGFDVFETGEISKEKENSLLETIKAYKHLLNAYEVTHLRACATSAMRDAKNSKAIIERIRKTTNVEIEIISGDLEASLIYETHIAEGLEKDVLYIYADVGSRSTLGRNEKCDSNTNKRYKESDGHWIWRQYQQNIFLVKKERRETTYISFATGLL